jgi:two-component system sensor kinase FixL
MPAIRNMSIKYKLISVTMATCIVALLIAGVVFIGWEWISLRKETVQNLSTQAEIMADNCKASVAFKDSKDAAETLRALHVDNTVVFSCIYTPGGKVFTSYYRDFADVKFQPPEIKDAGHYFSNNILTIFKPIVLDNDIIGTVCIRCDLHSMYVTLSGNAGIIIAVILLASLIAYLVSSRLQGIISGPILNLTGVARTVSEKKEYSTRVSKRSNDEVGLLIDSFNNMLEQIQQRDLALVNTNEQLDVKVKERTGELSSANAKLEGEIAEREITEHALRESEKRFSDIAFSSGDFIWEIDNNNIYIFVAGNLKNILGYSPEEIIGKTPFDLMKPGEVSRISQYVQTLMTEKKPIIDLENWNITKEGKSICLLTSGVPMLDKKGNLLGYRGIDKDITRRKEAEDKRDKLLKEQEDTNQELKDFAYIVSHDLKAPLRGIKTLAEWLVNDYSDKLGDEGKTQMNLLLSRVDRMHNLIEGILQYSRVGRAEEDLSLVNLNEQIAEIIDMLSPPKNISITVENELPTIRCEPTRISQVFQNLFSNAVKYMDKPDGIIKVGCVEEGAFWKFSVADNGPGIEEKYFERIFKIFQTLVPKDEYESTGIGLTVVKKIIELYGGRIWVESEVGKGSTFLFTLPKKESEVVNDKEHKASITC